MAAAKANIKGLTDNGQTTASIPDNLNDLWNTLENKSLEWNTRLDTEQNNAQQAQQALDACMASQLTASGFMNLNAHQTIYVVTPEHSIGSQLLFRDNVVPMIYGKHILILAASVTTGYTVQSAIEALNYYGGIVVGVSSIFSCVRECMGYPVVSVFNTEHLSDYVSTPPNECPLCKAGQKVDALVNTYGISSING